MPWTLSQDWLGQTCGGCWYNTQAQSMHPPHSSVLLPCKVFFSLGGRLEGLFRSIYTCFRHSLQGKSSWGPTLKLIYQLHGSLTICILWTLTQSSLLWKLEFGFLKKLVLLFLSSASPPTPATIAWASFVTQNVKNLSAIKETQVWSLGQEASAREGNGYKLQYSCL